MLFDKNTDSNVWEPLQIPMSDVFIGGKGGWPQQNPRDLNPNSPQPGLLNSRPVAGVDLHPSVRLSRDAITGEIVAAVTVLNQGWTSARNVELIAAQLKNQQTLGSVPTRHTFLARGESATFHLRFPSLPPGQTVVLRVSGRYKGGTFGTSLRVKLP
jgi:hypothetical protein